MGDKETRGSYVSFPLEEKKRDIIEYDMLHLTVEEMKSMAESFLRQSLDKLPLSVVEWRHDVLFGGDDE